MWEPYLARHTPTQPDGQPSTLADYAKETATKWWAVRWLALNITALVCHLASLGLLIWSFITTFDLNNSDKPEDKVTVVLTLCYLLWFSVRHIVNHIDVVKLVCLQRIRKFINTIKDDTNLNDIEKKSEMYNIYLFASMMRMVVFGLAYYGIIKHPSTVVYDEKIKNFFVTNMYHGILLQLGI